MPLNAYGLVTLFAIISILAGALATRLVGPRRWRAAIIPTAAAFLVLYLVGHRLGLAVGPQVQLFGFDVALIGDSLFALAAAGVAALAQRAVLGARGRAPA